MRIIIDDSDRYLFSGQVSFYGLMMVTAYLTVMLYVEGYYPGSHLVTIPVWLAGLVLARTYKILVKGIWGGFSCIFPIAFLPTVTVTAFHLTGFSHVSHAAHLLDVASVAIPIYMMLIRCGNLANSQLIGVKTTQRPYISYQQHQGNRVPIQLYEALAGLVILLLQLVNQPCLGRTPPGFNYLATMAAWSLTRFTVEFYKDDRTNLSTRRYGVNHEQQWVIITVILTLIQFVGFRMLGG